MIPSDNPKYIIGIDLGTTHTVMTYTTVPASGDEDPVISVFPVPQITNPGEIRTQPMLPSFLLLPGPHEVPEQGLALPWDPERVDLAVGEFARDRGV